MAAGEATTEVERKPEMARRDPTVFMVKRIVLLETKNYKCLRWWSMRRQRVQNAGDEAAERVSTQVARDKMAGTPKQNECQEDGIRLSEGRRGQGGKCLKSDRRRRFSEKEGKKNFE